MDEFAMTPIMKRMKKESAVSPVIGVMLMLVVTIIVAGVVAAFAGNIASTNEAAPSAVLKANINASWTDGWNDGKGALFVSSVNGDTINLNKTTVKVSKDGKTVTYDKPYRLLSGYLKSGETLNTVYGIYGMDKGSCLGKAFSDLGVTLSSGDVVKVTVIYDNKHVLFEKEVIAE